jgi:hypothetical protein
MNRKMFTLSLLAGLMILTLACTVVPTQAKSGWPTTDLALPQGNGNTGGFATNGAQGNGQGVNISLLPPANPGDLSDEEAQGLLYMREEEKMARDLYNAFYATWGLPVFQNIAGSEQTHMDAVKFLLDRYELADPTQVQPGVFTDPDLQALYDQLIASGSQSLGAALKAGGAVEEIDILDLQSRLELTDQADIQQVYNNLERGSENHLRTFVKTLLRQTGEAYQPQYLSPEAYQAILDGSMPGSGRGSGSQGTVGGRGGGQRRPASQP